MSQGNEHTVKAFDNDLNRLRGLLSEMGGRVEQALSQAIVALTSEDGALGAEVVAADAYINALESQIEQRAIQIIAMRAPMADDLREVIAAIKIASVIERIGDHAKNIARRAPDFSPYRPREATALLRSMAQIASDMVHDSLDALAARDADRCYDIRERDRGVDDFYNSIFRALVSVMMENPRTITDSAHLLFIAKNVERIGDQATNIAEMVYYAVTGEKMAERSRIEDVPHG